MEDLRTSAHQWPASAFGLECEAFVFDPEHPYFAANDTNTNSDPIDWETASPATVGLGAGRRDDAAAELAPSHDVASLLVARDGKLAFERYFNGSTATDADNVHSLSKSILSVSPGSPSPTARCRSTPKSARCCLRISMPPALPTNQL